jgi:hypothetical protein
MVVDLDCREPHERCYSGPAKGNRELPIWGALIADVLHLTNGCMLVGTAG